MKLRLRDAIIRTSSETRLLFRVERWDQDASINGGYPWEGMGYYATEADALAAWPEAKRRGRVAPYVVDYTGKGKLSA